MIDINYNNVSDLIELYKSHYRNNTVALAPRLPALLDGAEDTFCRLAAIYSNALTNIGNNDGLLEDTINNIRRVTTWLCTSERRGLLLMGNKGTGKSLMLLSIHILFHHRSTIGNAQEIFDYAKTNDEMKYWDERLLLIDDLGCEPENGKKYGENFNPIAKLLLHRYDKRLTTIIATNLDIVEIEKRYSDRVADRMYEMFEVIRYTQNSYRRC